MEVAAIMGLGEVPVAEWTAPPAPMIDPANEGLAYQRNIRTGLQSLSEVLRERGMDPGAVLAEIAADNKLLDKLGIILDSDPRNTTQGGNPRQFVNAAADTPDEPTGTEPTKPKPASEDDDEDEAPVRKRSRRRKHVR